MSRGKKQQIMNLSWFFSFWVVGNQRDVACNGVAGKCGAVVCLVRVGSEGDLLREEGDKAATA